MKGEGNKATWLGEKRGDRNTGRETKEEEPYLEKQQAEVGQRVIQHDPGRHCPAAPSQLSLSAWLPPTSLLHPSCRPDLLSTLAPRLGAFEAAGRVRGLDSAQEEVRRAGRKESPKQNRTQGSTPPSGSSLLICMKTGQRQKNYKIGIIIIQPKRSHFAAYKVFYKPWV